MGCGCGGSTANQGVSAWVYTAENGDQQQYPTKIEARAAMMRAGDTRSPVEAISGVIAQPVR